VQILVVVANIQVRNLSTEVDNGFVRTVIVHELVGPKVKVNPKKISTIMTSNQVRLPAEFKHIIKRRKRN